MVTRVPPQMITDGNPNVIFVRDELGNTREYGFEVSQNINFGCFCTYVSGTSYSVSAGKRTVSAVTGFLGADTTKTLSAFAPGSGNGSLDTGTIAASSFYYIHLIKNTSTGNGDILLSLSAATPVVPAGWTRIKRVGTIRINATTTIEPFQQIGNYFAYQQHIFEAEIGGGSNFNVTHTIPNQIMIVARIHIEQFGYSFSINQIYRIQSAGDPLGTYGYNFAGCAAGGINGQVGSRIGFNYLLPCNKSSLINYVTAYSYGSGSTYHMTLGWYDLEL